jgi:TonB family protein
MGRSWTVDPLLEECMLASWMLHTMVVAVVLTAAALAAESALRMAGSSARWVWIVAVLGTFVIPAWTIVDKTHVGSGAEGPVVHAVGVELPLLTPPVHVQTTLSNLDRPVAWLWALLSALLVARALLAFRRLYRLKRGWEEGELAGEQVLVSGMVGPAVVGWRRGQIVLPRWVLGRARGVQELILAHEREHLRARDPLLVALAGVLLVATPWNPLLWWQFRRLRAAIEMDCDRRVLRGRPGDRRAYGELLLEVGGLTVPQVGTAGLTGSRSTLERRIELLVQDLDRIRPEGVFIRASAGAVMLLVALLIPGPILPAPGQEVARVSTAGMVPRVSEDALSILRVGPVFTPFTHAPALRNGSEVQAAIQREYPSQLRSLGVDGKVLLYFLIDGQGQVRDARVARSSGREEFDAAALRVAPLHSFSPALRQDHPTPVWIALPVTFQSG